MTGFGDRFAQWCRDNGKPEPDADVRDVLTQCGAEAAADLQRNAPAIVQRVQGLNTFLQGVAARTPAPAPGVLGRLEVVQYSEVELVRSALDSLLDEATAHGDNETGGVLAGYVDTARLVLRVRHATPGGPNARREAHFYVGDSQYLQMMLNSIVAQTAGASDYVGEWHRHPGRQTHLSPLDSASLQTVASLPQYGTPQPVLIVCGLPDHTRRDERKITAYTCTGRDIYEVPLSVLPRETR